MGPFFPCSFGKGKLYFCKTANLKLWQFVCVLAKKRGGRGALSWVLELSLVGLIFLLHLCC